MCPQTELQTAEVKITTPFLVVANKSLARILNKKLKEVENDTNTAIERGVKTDENARYAEEVVRDGRLTIKVFNETRLQFTRPIDAGKKAFMKEVEDELAQLVEGNTKLDSMVMERVAKIRQAEAETRRKAEEAQRQAETDARAEEERRRKISIAKGGTGDVAPVVAETVVQPISVADLRSTTKVKSIVDKLMIETAVNGGVREIPGVHIYRVWAFQVIDYDKVPEEYRKLSR